MNKQTKNLSLDALAYKMGNSTHLGQQTCIPMSNLYTYTKPKNILSMKTDLLPANEGKSKTLKKGIQSSKK